MWHSCERWYQSTPDKSFLLAEENTLNDNARNVIQALTENLNVSEPLHYGQYSIYPIQGYHMPHTR